MRPRALDRLVRLALAIALGLAAWAWVGPRVGGAAPGSIPAGGVPGYDVRLRDPGHALCLLETGRPVPDVEALNRLVYASLEHGAPPPVPAREAWLLWLAGRVVPDLRSTQDPRRLLRGGRGICSDAVIVLAALCERAGLRAEMVDLRGHVVARVFAPDGCWIADPDLGVAFRDTLSSLVEPEGLDRVRAALLVRGHPPGRVSDAVRALASVEDNVVVHAGVLSPRLAWAERALDAAGRALPLALAASALALSALRTRRR